MARFRAGALDVDTYGLIDTAANTLATVNAALAYAATHKISQVRLRPHGYDFSSGHILVPANVELTGHGELTVITGGAFAIVNDGTVSSVTLGTGWTLDGTYFGANSGGTAVIGGTTRGIRRQKPITGVFPTRTAHNTLARTVGKLNTLLSLKKTKVLIIGDSLSRVGSGTGIHWSDLLFNNTYAAAEGLNYNVANWFGANNTTVTNLAITGSSMTIDTGFLAVEQYPISTGSKLVDQVKMAETTAGMPPFLSGEYDLAIIAQGMNSTAGFVAEYEGLIAALRNAGTDVLLHTQNPNSANAASIAANIWHFTRLAQYYGCALADTHSAFRREIYSGRVANAQALLADSPHPNQAGWNLYAQTILDVLRDQTYDAPAPARPPAKRMLLLNNPSEVNNANGFEHLSTFWVGQFDPVNQSAGVTRATPLETTSNPIVGRRASTTNTAILIPVGEWVEFACADAFDVQVIGEGDTSATPTPTGAFSLDGGSTTTASFTQRGITGVYSTGLSPSQWSGGSALASKTLRITSTLGTLRILGVTFSTPGRRYQPRNADGTFTGVTYGGTWQSEAGPFFGLSNIPYTDTANSYAEWDLIGDGFSFKSARGASGGSLRVLIDGVAQTIFDCYSASITGMRSYVATGLTYGRHKVRVTFESVNGSASAAGSGTAHRMMLFEVAALDTRMNATFGDLARPANDLTSGPKGDTGPTGTNGAGAYDIQTFPSGGTWVKPATANRVTVMAIGGGGGGGSGCRNAAGTVRSGGSGGGGGGFTLREIAGASLPSTVTVAIGAAGVGAVAVATDTANGTSGTAGGVSTFGTYVRAMPGNPGNGGTAATVSAGQGGIGGTGAGGAGGGVTTAGGAGATAAGSTAGNTGATGGGAGGGISAANVATIGGNGGQNTVSDNGAASPGAIDGTAPANGNSQPTGSGIPGNGGAGGWASLTQAAAGGGNGGSYGGGGGGGGASVNGNASGKGGDGGAGFVVVITQ